MKYMIGRLQLANKKYVKNALNLPFKCDLNSGIYNYLKHTRYTGKSVAEIMAMVDKYDIELEGNLSTILQPVRGTNQYWYKVKGELKCMIRE